MSNSRSAPGAAVFSGMNIVLTVAESSAFETAAKQNKQNHDIDPIVD
jgi:hypothetical protein